jgi:hypothetical protein
MKHPNREEWMSYLYDELETEPRRALDRHLEQCAECRDHVAQWRSTSKQLDAFEVSAARPVASLWPVWVRWATAAAAAVVILAGGFALGRFTGASRTEVAALRNQIAALATDAESRAIAAARAETQSQLQPFAAAVSEQLRTTRAQHAADYASLRKELETVAVLTEVGFRQTENQIVELASADTASPANSKP